MPPTNFDAMLQEVSNHMAKSQFLRRLSSNSSSNASASTSTSSKRGSKRVVKVKSVGNSPHNILQRRKTTASHSSRTSNAAPQGYNYQLAEQRMDNVALPREMFPSTRPMSWHPGSRAYEAPMEHFPVPVPAPMPAMKSAIAGFQNLAVASTQASPTDHIPQHTLPLHSAYSINNLSYGPSDLGLDGYAVLDSDAGNTYPSYPLYPLAGQSQYVNNSLPYGYHTYPSTSMGGPLWDQTTSEFATFSAARPAEPLPIQYPLDPVPHPRVTATQQLPKKRSKELFGMGLYDHNVSSLDFSASPPSHFAILDRQSSGQGGKGLKLEETWSPSTTTATKHSKGLCDEDEEDEEDEEEEEEEVYTSSEIKEDRVTILDPTPGTEPQASLYPAYGDLSNQTFFFDGDDPYTDCLPFDHQAMGIYQQPKIPEANGVNEHGNLLWF